MGNVAAIILPGVEPKAMATRIFGKTSPTKPEAVPQNCLEAEWLRLAV